jgi:putative hydrolase of the HAD superfamily
MPGPDLRSVEALLFDCGNVVIEAKLEWVFARWAEHAGCDPALFAEKFAFDDAFARHERGELDWAGYCANLREVFGVDISDAQFLDGWNTIWGDDPVLPGMDVLLGKLSARLPLYAFTNSNPEHEAVWSVRFAELFKPFRKIYNSSTLKMRKPEIAAFHYIARDIGVAPGRILFFDDFAPNVEGARAAGLQAVQVTSHTTVAETLSELLA